MYHKETFMQPAHDGIPRHWVVQYWVFKNDDFCQAQYFSDLKAAIEFEATLIHEEDDES